MILDLVRAYGLVPHNTSLASGGVWASACPRCKEGHDRFVIWEGKGRYWCRRCKVSGDSIQFCRDFLKMSYQDARVKIGNPIAPLTAGILYREKSFQPNPTVVPEQQWKLTATKYIECAHEILLHSPEGLEKVSARGLTRESIMRFQIGWQPIDEFDLFPRWGFSPQFKKNGKERRIWLPRGIVIPSFSSGDIQQVKIRRADWHPEDKYPKYVHVSGGSNRFSVYGDPSKNVVVLVESELDAMLLVQEAGHLCCCLAPGGLKKPDEQTHRWLMNKGLILFALDFDEAGKAWFPFWQKSYFAVRPWPVPIGKSPEAAYGSGCDLSVWVQSGIQRFKVDECFF